MVRLEQVTVERLDAEYASLRFPIGEQARRIQGFREEARKKEGKGSAAELGWKQHANSMYGVAASRHMAVNNVVLANVVTATARALAFAMSQSLNAIQTITDGCSYRRDQIPSGTFADCLATAPDYPIRRLEAGVGFADRQASDRHRVHRVVPRSFAVLGVTRPDYKRPQMEHKRAARRNRRRSTGSR